MLTSMLSNGAFGGAVSGATARAFGSRDIFQAECVFRSAIVIAFIGSVIMMGIFFTFAEIFFEFFEILFLINNRVTWQKSTLNHFRKMFQIYLMGVIYTILGIVHFTNTRFYRPLMPKFLPAHDLLIYLSGGAEILLGIGILFPQTRVFSLWRLIAMLIVFLIVHVNMLFPSNGLGISPWILWLRIPIQFLLIYWAFINLPKPIL